MRTTITTILLFVATINGIAQTKDELAIRGMLAAQVGQWNRGSIDGYMKGYWESDSLVFIGAKGPRYGYNITLQKYKDSYPDADHMGKLTSTISSLQKLSPDYYFIIGSWGLQRKAGDLGGTYTLLLRRIKGKWVIVCDHSS